MEPFSGSFICSRKRSETPGLQAAPGLRFHVTFGIRLWIAAWATHGANSSRQPHASTRPQRACAGRFSFAPDSKAGHRQGRPRSAQPIPSPKPSLKPNRFFGGLLIRSGWRKEPCCCSHFSAGLRSVFAAAAPRNRRFFAPSLIATKPVKPCDGAVFGALDLLLKMKRNGAGS